MVCYSIAGILVTLIGLMIEAAVVGEGVRFVSFPASAYYWTIGCCLFDSAGLTFITLAY